MTETRKISETGGQRQHLDKETPLLNERNRAIDGVVSALGLGRPASIAVPILAVVRGWR